MLHLVGAWIKHERAIILLKNWSMQSYVKAHSLSCCIMSVTALSKDQGIFQGDFSFG